MNIIADGVGVGVSCLIVAFAQVTSSYLLCSFYHHLSLFIMPYTRAYVHKSIQSESEQKPTILHKMIVKLETAVSTAKLAGGCAAI